MIQMLTNNELPEAPILGKLKPIDFKELRPKAKRDMYKSLCVPSIYNVYSIAVESMQKWFLCHFPEGTFKSVYVDGSNVFKSIRDLSKKELLKKEKPSLAIVPSIDLTFNDGGIDSHMYGLNVYSQRGAFLTSFFNDQTNNIHLGINMEALLMHFTFKCKFYSRAQQLDFYKFIKIACKVDSSEYKHSDMDFHIPYELVMQLAIDTGFEIVSENGEQRIKNIPGFLRYLNTYSVLPFMYKYRGVNGNHEFFVRMQNLSFRIKPTDFSADEGEREGQMYNNYGIELTTEVRFPSPMTFAYYSTNEHELNKLYSANDVNAQQMAGPLIYCTIKDLNVPLSNEKDWPKFLTTNYDDDTIGDDDVMVIDFNELFEGDLKAVIDDTLASAISPAIFIDIWVVDKDGNKVLYNMDWASKLLTTKTAIGQNCHIALYCDHNYMNTRLINMKNMASSRVSDVGGESL